MAIAVQDFNFVRDMVRQDSAIVLETGKEYLVESRLQTLARSEGFASLEQFLAELRARPQMLRKKVVEAMTTNETSFFRDVHPFEALKTGLVPELVKRHPDRRLDIWCAACSSGQEPYTVAMTLMESLPQPDTWTIRILATDLSTEMLERTKAGKYSQLEVNRGLPAMYLVKYFQKTGTEWQVNEKLRRMIDVRLVNLIEPFTNMPAFDIVFLRNVLIYFDVPTKKGILQKMRKVMRPDGYLFLGGAETTINVDEAWQRVQFGRGVCYKPTS